MNYIRLGTVIWLLILFELMDCLVMILWEIYENCQSIVCFMQPNHTASGHNQQFSHVQEIQKASVYLCVLLIPQET